MSKYTPGPWYVESLDDTYGGYVIVQAAEEQETWVSEGYEVSDSVGERRHDIATARDAANAALIAKAPQMHALLLDAMEQFPDIEAGNTDIVDWLVEFVERAHWVIEEARNGS
jgi:hypothetical protein